MKRFFTLVLILFSSSFLNAKIGIGVQGGAKLNPSADWNAGISFRSDCSPWGIAASWNGNDKSLDLIFDNWWIYKRLDERTSWFALWGMSFSGRFENEAYADTGARLGIGINAFCFENRCLELYAHAAWNPSLGIRCDREEEKYSFRFVPACFPFNAGVRFWL